MVGFLSGLEKLGLGNLEMADIYEDTHKGDKMTKEEILLPAVNEKDLIYDKSYECPVCSQKFTAKIMKTGRARLLGKDQDLRPRYDGIDSLKYDILMCPICGYAALMKSFPIIGTKSIKAIQEKISMNVCLKTYHNEIYSYEQALERYKLALACAVVKHSKNSEKAFICLKNAWLLRGYAESLENSEQNKAKIQSIKAEEEEYLQNAYHGFIEALKLEDFPMCGMDEMTMNYLLAVMSIHFKKYDIASRMVAAILTSSTANSRIKDKARDLKDQILAELRLMQARTNSH